jgi:hypothetical protein
VNPDHVGTYVKSVTQARFGAAVRNCRLSRSRAGAGTGEFRATWYDLFPGGCLTYQLHSTSDVKGSFTAELPALITFATRDALRQALRQRSDGRLWLDPVATSHSVTSSR